MRFASSDALVSTERACVWTLSGLLDGAQFERLRREAQSAFQPFVDGGRGRVLDAGAADRRRQALNCGPPFVTSTAGVVSGWSNCDRQACRRGAGLLQPDTIALDVAFSRNTTRVPGLT